MRFKVSNSALASGPRTPVPRASPVQLNNTSAINFSKNLCSFHAERDLLTETYYFEGGRFFSPLRRARENSSISIMRWVAVRFSKLS